MSVLLLLLTATIWGSAFVAQSVGMEHVGPFTFTFSRSIIGGIVLLPCILFLGKWKKGFATKVEWIGGICCGIALCIANNLQQVGMQYTTVGKAGFITALYVVLVPIFGIFLKKRVSLLIWGCVAVSVVGLYLLCIPEGAFVLAFGDLLVLLCAVVFSVHILIIDYFSPKGDGVVISCIQFFTCGILSGIPMLFFENPSIGSMIDAKWSILYAGVLSSGVAYTLQVVAQKNVNPTVASLILCLESVVAVLAGWVMLGQGMSSREIWGCILMFAAIVMAQLPAPEKTKERD
ncbi:MAG: DMT family transporter [Tyzzerella sp.]|nr:DMT family transporter [Tyzzerella sp.]